MLPRVILYNAISLDGSIDLTSVDMGTYYGLVAVWHEDATMAGSKTILKGGSKVPPERPKDFEPWKVDPDDRRAVLVVPDSRGRVRSWHFLRRSGYWRDVMALCSRSTPKSYLRYLEKRHIGFIIAGERKVDLRAALETLRADFGMKTVRVDSGGTLNGILLREGLVSELSLLIHPDIVGGAMPRAFYAGPAMPEGFARLELFGMRRVGKGLVWLRYRVVRPVVNQKGYFQA